MVTNISELKKLKKNNGFVDTIDKSMQKKSFGDPRFWKPTFKQDGTAKATIRFLPAPKGEDDAVLRILKHFVQNGNGVYSEISRKTISDKEPDPCQDYAWKHWKKGDDANNKRYKKFLAVERFYCNIYVVKDEGAPENDGKVFLYEAPKTVAQFIQAAGVGDDDTPAIEVNGFWEAHNFILNLYKEKGFAKYDKCKFSAKATDLLETDDLKAYEKLWADCHKLLPFLDEIKPYSELKARFNDFMGVESDEDDDDDSPKSKTDDEDEDTASVKKKTSLTTAKGSSKSDEDDEGESKTDDDEDEDDSYYQRLANRKRARGGE